jgi:hypothetical protein
MAEQTPISPEQPLYQWSAPIHPVHERSPQWYLYGGLFVVGCAIYGVLTDSWTFSLVILLLGGLYFLTRRAPEVVRQMTILSRGFQLGDSFTAWEDCKDFWIVRSRAYTQLHIHLRRGWIREVTILLPNNIDVTQFRATVSQILPERSDQGERLLDMLIRTFKL